MAYPLDIPTQTGPIAVSVAYIVLYYAFQINIAYTKMRLEREYAARGEKLDRYFGQDRELLAADRYQLNMLEHMPPFLALLWLNAVFVSPGSATVAGGIYVAARLLYPFVMGARVGKSPRGLILLATVPGYLVIAVFVVHLLIAMVHG